MRKNMDRICALIPKPYTYLANDNDENKIAKVIKKVCFKRKN